MKLVPALIISLAVLGCGGTHRVHLSPAVPPSIESGDQAATMPGDSLDTFMAKVRKLSVEARPKSTSPETVETQDPRLAAALAAAVVAPASTTFRAVAFEYHRLGIFDKANQYLGRALAVDETDGAAYDARARLWRDSGLPQLGLVDAYRAIFFAPRSAVARNTLGTILQAMGHRTLARGQYLEALRLDPSAAYALSNVCYVWIMEGQASHAIDACQKAVALQPDLAAAWNNLGLAHASAGHASEARAAFAAGGDPAAAWYNTGIVLLAHRQYGRAVEAFRAAHALRPAMTTALARAAQANAAATGSTEE